MAVCWRLRRTQSCVLCLCLPRVLPGAEGLCQIFGVVLKMSEMEDLSMLVSIQLTILMHGMTIA